MIYLRIPLEFKVENFSVLDTAHLIRQSSATQTALVEAYFGNLYGKLHASMEPWSCSILPSVKIKWNRQKKDKQLVGDRKSQFCFPSFPPLLLHLCCIGFSPCFLSYPPCLLDQATEQWEGHSVQGEGGWTWWQFLKLFSVKYTSAFHNIQLASYSSAFPL